MSSVVAPRKGHAQNTYETRTSKYSYFYSCICRKVNLTDQHVTEKYENYTATTVDLLCSAMFRQSWN